MTKYQEALDTICTAMYENVNYRGTDTDGQPIESYMGEDYRAELNTLQELINVSNEKGNQVCVRTYPSSFDDPIENIKKYLSKGYKVVMCNSFNARTYKGEYITGNEYILEKKWKDENN